MMWLVKLKHFRQSPPCLKGFYSLLIKFDFKKLKHMFHKALKKSFNLQLVDLK